MVNIPDVSFVLPNSDIQYKIVIYFLRGEEKRDEKDRRTYRFRKSGL